MKVSRHRIIAEYVEQNNSAGVEELAAYTGVSPATIRRDLSEMAEKGELIRTHGGAVRDQLNIFAEPSFNERLELHKAEKNAVTEAAAKYVKDGQTIYIGAGTTARMLASKICNVKDLTVITNDVAVARTLYGTDVTVIVAGGQMKRDSFTLIGYFAEETVRQMKVDTAFVITDGADINKGFIDYNMDEVRLKQMAMGNAENTIILCDSSKFGISGGVEVCPIEKADVIITNNLLSEENAKGLKEKNLNVVFAD